MENFRDLTEAEAGELCACTLEECACSAPADFLVAGVFLCGCCYGDCPEVHPARATERWASMEEVLTASYATVLAEARKSRHPHPVEPPPSPA